MSQDLFDWDAAEGNTIVHLPAPKAPVRIVHTVVITLPSSQAPARDWHWWDPLPHGLSSRQAMVWQIRRDLRAFEETGDVFFQDRVRAYRDALKEAP